MALLAMLAPGCATVDSSALQASLKGRYVDEPQVIADAASPPLTAATTSGPMRTFGNARDVGSVVLYGARNATVANRPVDAYLERLCQRLLAAWPHARLARQPRLMLTADPAYGAVAEADGRIRVNLGLLTQVETEDEMAFVVAHELGHLLRYHNATREEEIGQMRDLRQLGDQVIATGAMLANSNLGRQALSGPGDQAEARKATMIGLASSMTLREALDTVADPAWARGQEAQADLVGVDLMAAAGFDPSSASDAFDRLQGEYARSRSQAEQAGAALQSGLGDRLVKGDLRGMLSQAVDGFVAVANGAAKDFQQQLQTRHPPPAERSAAVLAYVDRTYPDRAAGAGQLGEIERLRNLPRIRAMREAADNIAQAQQALLEGQPQEALRWAQAALAATPDSTAARYQLAVAQIGLGQSQAARDGLRRVKGEAGLPLEGYITLARLEQQTGSPAAALATLDEGGRSVGNPDIVLPNRLELHLLRHDKAAAETEAARCAASPQRAVRSLCRDIMEQQERPGAARPSGLGLPDLGGSLGRAMRGLLR
ncbi:M48 family metalloprotease [Teichococcus coralli]|nr:M48 family metalloprotease [Pseudoroseomonas coralli]